MNKTRIVVAALSLSAAGFISIVGSEGYTDKAIVPVAGDVYTYGFGSTVKEDGSPVKKNDKITPQRALVVANNHISKEEEIFRASIPEVKLYQTEYDLYMDFVYQFGSGTWNSSSMRKSLLAGDYVSACKALLKYKFVAGRDCSVRSNGCYGVWARQLERYDKCIGAQS